MKRKLVTYRLVFQYNPIFGLLYDCHITSEDILIEQKSNQKIRKQQKKNHQSIVLQKNLFERQQRQLITKSVEFHQKHSIDNIDNESQETQTKVVLININKRTVRQYKQRKFYLEQTKEIRRIQKNKVNKRLPEKRNKSVVRDLLNEKYVFNSDFINNNIGKDYNYRKDDKLIISKNKIITPNGNVYKLL